MQTNPHSRGVLGYVAQGGILLAIGLAAVALIGWLLGLTQLASFRSDYIPMAPSTALAFLVLGAAAWAVLRWPARPAAQWFGRGAAALVLLLCLLILFRPALGLDPEAWFYQPSGFLVAAPLGRMSLLTAIALLLAGSSLLALLAGRRLIYDVATVLLAGATAIGSVVLVGYWYETPLLYGATIVPVALPTALALLALSSGLLALIGPHSRFLRALGGSAIRARILRAFIPAVIGLTLLQGWLGSVALPWVGIANPALAAALVALAAGATVGGVTWLLAQQIAAALDKAEIERRRAEAALRASEARYRDLFEQVGEGIGIVGAEERFVVVNAAGEAIFGTPPGGLVGRSLREFTDPAQYAMILAQTARRRQGEKSTYELNIHRLDGGECTILVTAHPQYDERGQFLGTRGVFRDITERKQAEEALRDSEERFRLAFHDTAIGMALVDTRGCFWQVNPALCRMLGYAEEELLGKSFQEITYPDDRPAGADLFRRVLTGEMDYLCFEKRYVRKDGGLIWVLVSSSIIRDSQGRPRYFVSHMQDISERKAAEEALRRRADEWAALYATSLDLVTPYRLPDILHAIVERAAMLLSATSGGLYLCEPELQQVRCVVSYNTVRDFTGVVLNYGEGAAGMVATTGQPLIIDDYRVWPGRAAVYDADQPFSAILSVPLIWQGQVTGVIHVLHDTETRRFTQAEQELLTLFAQQAAIAVANARLLEDERAARVAAEVHERHLLLLNDITRAIIARPDLASALQIVADRLGELLDADGSYLTLWDEAHQRVVPAAAYGPLRAIYSTLRVEPGEPTATEAVLRAGRVLTIADVHHSPYLSPRIAGLFPARSLLCLPLIVGEQKLGAALIGFNQPHVCTQDEIARGEQAANLLALAIAKNRLLEMLQQRAEELTLLNQVAELASRPTAPARMLQQILDALMPALGFDAGWITLPGATLDDRPTLAASRGVSPQFVAAEAARPLADCPACSYVLTHGSIAGPLTLAQCPRLDPAVIAAEGLQHHIGVPLEAGDRILGILNVGFRRTALYDERQLALLTAVGRQVGLALDNAHLYQSLQAHAATLEATVARRTAELQQANERLKELDRLKQEFIAQASHELRTPLTNIKTSVYLLDHGKPEKRGQYMAILSREADVLHRLVEDLLALLTLDVGQLRPVKQPVAIGALVERLAAEQADLLAGRALTLAVTCAPDLPQLQADPKLLTQALVNLIANAAERSPHGREIVVACDRQVAEGDWVTIAVREPEIVIASMAGAGLRRVICEEIARHHGGRLTDDERSVTLWLPVGE